MAPCRNSARRGMTLVEVMVALALSLVFLLLTSNLEVQSLRSLSLLHARRQAMEVARSLVAQTQAGWMRNTLTPSSGKVTRSGIEYDYTVTSTAIGLGDDLEALPADAVAGRTWEGMRRVTFTIEWMQGAGMHKGKLEHTIVVTDTVPQGGS